MNGQQDNVDYRWLSTTLVAIQNDMRVMKNDMPATAMLIDSRIAASNFCSDIAAAARACLARFLSTPWAPRVFSLGGVSDTPPKFGRPCPLVPFASKPASRWISISWPTRRVARFFHFGRVGNQVPVLGLKGMISHCVCLIAGSEPGHAESL
jgi:hypothetical protein